MIKISFDDPNLVENFKSIQELKKSGMFTDEQLQKMYDEQVERDRREELKPCPFCGGKPDFLATKYMADTFCTGIVFSLVCNNCGGSISRSYCMTIRLNKDGSLYIEADNRQRAIEEWNKRVGE